MKITSFLASFLILIHPLAAAEKETVMESTDSPAKEEAPESPEPAVLTFADETRISGYPKTIDGPAQLMTVKSPSLAGEAVLKTDRLLEMALKGEPEQVASDHYAIATIKKHHNQNYHDNIRGRLIRLDDELVVLDTWYAGRLEIRRSFVKSLDIYNQSPSFYVGPNGPEGWVATSGNLQDSWTFENRSMTSRGRNGIARKIDIPTKAKISFTTTWKSSPYFRILLFSDDSKRSYPNTGYSLNVQQSYLALYRHSRNARNNDIISESIRNLFNAESARFTIFLNRNKEGTSAIYIDDVRIGTWTGPDDTKLTGEWLHFVPQNDNPLRFSKISVSQWDGVLPRESEPNQGEDGDAQEDDSEGQQIRLANGDVVIGSVDGIEEGMAALTTPFGEVKVPVRFMRSVALITEKNEVRMEKNDVRAWFHQGGYITLKLKSLDDKVLKGYSQAWGDAEFNLDAFSRIEFNIWRPELDAARYGMGDDW